MDTKTYNRLIAKINITATGCWEWQGCLCGVGYGTISVNNKVTMTHRAMYKAVHGDIPKGICVCHHCDNPLCINPEHLFLGTQKDNLQDMIQKGRLPDRRAISKKMWTPEKKAKRKKEVRERLRKIHILETKEAGVPENWKCCLVCKTWMPISEFNIDRQRADNHDPRCRHCRAIQLHEIYVKRRKKQGLYTAG